MGGASGAQDFFRNSFSGLGPRERAVSDLSGFIPFFEYADFGSQQQPPQSTMPPMPGAQAGMLASAPPTAAGTAAAPQTANQLPQIGQSPQIAMTPPQPSFGVNPTSQTSFGQAPIGQLPGQTAMPSGGPEMAPPQQSPSMQNILQVLGR